MGSGKIYMLKNCCFNDVTFSMMVTITQDGVCFQFLYMKHATITFHGVAAHAGCFPWEGVNALEAAVMAYSGIGMMRVEVHGVIHEGGVKPNIIPDKARMEFYL